MDAAAPLTNRDLADRLYRPSGKVSFLGSTLAAVAAIGVGVVAGGLYGVLVWWVPYVKAMALITGFCTLLLFLLGMTLAHVGRLRSSFMAAAIGLAAGLAFYYASWCTWLPLVFDELYEEGYWRWVGRLLADPAAVWSGVAFVYENGSWSLSSETEPTRGWFLGALWAIEALVLIVPAMFGAWSQVGGQPYCETCGSWATTEKDVAHFAEAVEMGMPLKRAVLADPLGSLAALGPADAASGRWMRADLDTCRCGELNCLTLHHVHVAETEQGQTLQSCIAVPQVVLAADEAAELREVGRRQAAEDEHVEVDAAGQPAV